MTSSADWLVVVNAEGVVLTVYLQLESSTEADRSGTTGRLTLPCT